MNKIIAILGGIGAGAALMYLFDPNGGNRRRALIRDKAVGLSHDVRDTVGKRSRDLSNRAKGLLHEAKSVIPGSGTGQTQQQAEPSA
jgi:hypothetical protein